MKRIISLALCFMLVFTLCPSVFAASNITWTGAVDGSWHSAGNWDLNKIPVDYDYVYVPESSVVEYSSGETSVRLNCAGNLTVSGGTLKVASGVSSLTNGKLDGAGDIEITVGGNFSWSGGSIEGPGKIIVDENANFYATPSPLDRYLVNNGSLLIQADSLKLTGGAEGNGNFTIQQDKTLELGGNKSYNLSKDLYNMGVLRISNACTSVSLSSGYVQQNTGTLEFDIGGLSDFTQLEVTGYASLNGELKLNISDEYVPSPGDTFNIMTYSLMSGGFTSIVSNMEGITFEPTYTSTGLTLTVSGETATVWEVANATDLETALNGFESGDTIKLLGDIDYEGGIVVVNKSVTFDLNGCTLNVVNNAETNTAEEMSGLFVIGDAAVDLVDLSGVGELNVTGSWYGVYAASTVDETDSVTNKNTLVTVTNALGHECAGVMATDAKVTVKGNAASDAGGYGASANFQYAEVTVEGNVTASGNGCVGILPNSSAKITVKGSVTVSGYNSRGIEAYDRGEAIVEKDITASGTGSIGIISWRSNVTAGGNVTGDYGGINAFRSDVYITGDVRTLGFEVNNYGVRATSFSHIYVEGDVRSNEKGAVIWAEDNETPSMIVIGGVIEAPKYVQIGIKTLDFTNGRHTTSIDGCYIIYEDPDNIYVGAVGVAEYAGGSGSVEDPYLVVHADQLYNVRNHLDKHFRQIANLDLSGYSTDEGWEPIGGEYTPFTGSFDGDGKVINNLFISRGTSDYVGLFGYTGKTAEIRNLGLENAETTGKNFVGSLIGYSMGKIMNSYSAGNVNGRQFVGGLVGYNFREGLSLGGTITSSYSSCTVTAMDFDAGGLAGRNARGVIANSFAIGNVSSPVSVGGLVGASVGEVGNKNVGLITNSYATGEVSATVQDAGGLVGQNSALISYSFATGGVSCPNNVGGLAGYIYNWGRTENSYWDTITSDQNASAGGGTGKTTAEMKQQITYEGWDFDTIWGINSSKNNGYPFLRWQGYEAEPTAPSAPQNFTATSGDGQVALSWTAPASDGGAAISHYEVSSDNGSTWVTASASTSHTFTGLTNGTAYTFKVRAVNSVGSGAEASATATPTEYVCEIGAAKYTTLGQALEAATSGQTIKLLNNITHTSSIEVDGKTIYFELGNYNLLVDTSDNPDESIYYVLTVKNGGKVKLAGTGAGKLNVKSSSNSHRYGIRVLDANSEVTVNNVDVTGEGAMGVYMYGSGSALDGGTITVNGHLNANYIGVWVNAKNGHVVINGDITSGHSGVQTATNPGTSVTVNGNITVLGTTSQNLEGAGILASGKTTVNVAGDVTGQGANYIGVYALGGTITVGGNVVSSGIGAKAKPNYSYGNGAVTIDGSLSAGTPFIIVGTTEKATADITDPTTKTGFLTYSDGISNVWIGSIGAPVVTEPTVPQNFWILIM